MDPTPVRHLTRTTARPAASRSLAPDLSRGLILAWIAVANSMAFLIARPYGYRQHIVEHDVIDRVTSVLVVAFVDGRAYPLFAFLFGYGVIQLMRHQEARGVTPDERRRVLRRRSLALLAIGFGHAMLFFPGDILGTYAVLGLVLLVLLRFSDRRLVRIAVWGAVIATLVNGVVYGAPGAGERQFLWSLEMSSVGDILVLRPVEWLMSPFALLQVVPAVLLGVLAARRRVLEHPDQRLPLLRRAALICVPVGILGGLPSGLAVVGVIHIEEFGTGAALAMLHSASGLVAGLGLVAAIAWFSACTANGPVVQALAALGRCSLSGYLALSAVFAVLLSPLGLGLGTTLGTTAAAALALATWGVTIGLAVAVRRMGRRGPAETLLRGLTYGRP